ncbi:MAG: dTDP-4-dehydrorhamnose reductase [Chlamydiia bacterium]
MRLKDRDEPWTWVIGGQGMLGHGVQKVLKSLQEPFLATDRRVDITHTGSLDEFLLSQSTPPTWVINCAAYTAVDRAERDEETAFAVNALGPEILGQLARKYGFHVIHVSTDYVFGGRPAADLLETALPCPISTYGRSKLEGEQRLLSRYPEATIVRTSWLFGPSGNHFVSKILRAMMEREVVHVVNDQEGRPTFTLDLARALVSLRKEHGLFHFANAGSTSWHGFATHIRQTALELGLPVKCTEVQPIPSSAFPSVAKRPTYSVLSTDKVEGLGIMPRSWQAAVTEYLHSLDPHAPSP